MVHLQLPLLLWDKNEQLTVVKASCKRASAHKWRLWNYSFQHDTELKTTEHKLHTDRNTTEVLRSIFQS